MKSREATTSVVVVIAVALVAGAAVYLFGGSQIAQADRGTTTATVAAAAGARVLPTDPPLKVEPK